MDFEKKIKITRWLRRNSDVDRQSLLTDITTCGINNDESILSTDSED